MASGARQSQSLTSVQTTVINVETPVHLRLRLREPESSTAAEAEQRVTWAEGTVDNEHMGRLRSNCCCVYVKPRVWDADTSSEEEDEPCCNGPRRKVNRLKGETEHCRGHTEAEMKTTK